jgi:regulator of protease activity HflC (stomatin/prohibitin superfamily)
MAELTAIMTSMGIEVIGVYVPEKRMKNDDIRQEVAKQAVIGIKAEAERSAADAKAYATIQAARAEAEAIETLARAHAEAGQKLGSPESTAARMALTETTAKALQGSTMTIFSGAPDKIPFLLNSSS